MQLKYLILVNFYNPGLFPWVKAAGGMRWANAAPAVDTDPKKARVKT